MSELFKFPGMGVVPDEAITLPAAHEVYDDIYRVETLPLHIAAWRLSLRALARFGRPMCYTTSDEPSSHALTSPLSTGFLATAPSMEQDGGLVVPAMRISMEGNYIVQTLPWRTGLAVRLRQAALHSGESDELGAGLEHRLRRVAKSLKIESVTAATSGNLIRNLVPGHLVRHTELNVSPRHGLKQQTLVRAKEHPDMRCWTVPESIFPYAGELAGWYELEQPTRIQSPSHSNDGTLGAVNDGLEEAGRLVADPCRAIIDRLSPLGTLRPLRTIPDFSPALNE